MSGVIGVDVQLLFKLSRGTSQYMTSYPTESYFNLNETWLGICINTPNFRDAKYSSVYFFTPSKKFRKPQKISNSGLEKRIRTSWWRGIKLIKVQSLPFSPWRKRELKWQMTTFENQEKLFLSRDN